MKIMKRGLGVFLAVCCLISMLPVLCVQAQAPYEVSVYESAGRIRVDIDIYDFSASPLEIVIEEPLPLSSDIRQAPLVVLNSKAGFETELKITMAGPGCGVSADWQSGSSNIVTTPDLAAGNQLSVKVTGTSSFLLLNEAIAFPDIPEDFWARDEIDFMTARGYITGMLDGTFAPSDSIQRRTVAMLLWRIAGSPEVTGTCPFPDVKNDRYYQAILWAYQNKIINGYNDGTFRPEDKISRQHFIVMLKRYADKEGLDLATADRGNISDFYDYNTINPNFREAAQWGLDCGLVLGRSNNTYDPEGNASRAQMAVILCRFILAWEQASPGSIGGQGRPDEMPIG